MRRYSLAEVVLLLIFAAGLLLSLLLVNARSRIDLSEPIALPHSGVAVSVPVGPGWQGPGQWVYEAPSEFVLTAALQTGSQIAARVHYQYLLAAEGMDPAEFLKQTATAANLRVARSGRISEHIKIAWVQLYAPGGTADTVIGAASLPHGRALILHVRAQGDSLLGTKLFRTLAGSIIFAPGGQIARGSEFVGQLRASGLTRSVEAGGGLAGETVFFISDPLDQPRGFQITQFRKNADGEAWGVLRGERVDYTAGTRGSLSRSYFECNDAFDRYIWHTRRGRLRGGGGGATEIDLAADGTLRISGGSLTRDVTCRPGAALPEMLIEQAARAYLDGLQGETLVNVIFDEGLIVPAMITAVDCSSDERNVWAAVHCVQFAFLPTGSQMALYFDRDKRLVGRVDDNRRVLVWNVSDRRRLTEAFGDLGRFLGAENRTE
ncbi:MAG: hypothetical protein IH624_07635 [Phycisphaerae bacterium]|nr:hypothetical protein [Phycisphaerae bacterium]